MLIDLQFIDEPTEWKGKTIKVADFSGSDCVIVFSDNSYTVLTSFYNFNVEEYGVNTSDTKEHWYNHWPVFLEAGLLTQEQVDKETEERTKRAILRSEEAKQRRIDTDKREFERLKKKLGRE